MWDRGASLHHAQLAEHISRFDANAMQALDNMHAGGDGTQQSYQMLNRLIDQQAFMLSANDIFFVSALLFLALIGDHLAGAAGPFRRRRRRCGGGRRLNEVERESDAAIQTLA